MITVRDLVRLLQTFPPDLPVCYRCHSEQILLQADEVRVESLCHARADGWIADARPDKPSTPYLVFPGN